MLDLDQFKGNQLICTHRIFLEGSNPIQQPLKRLNPMLKEVLRNEVTRLLEANIIYAISNSEWVSPIQIILKKTSLTMVRNKHSELQPFKIPTSWIVCIDYRKLNVSTRKDHFSFPFFDQILVKIIGHPTIVSQMGIQAIFIFPLLWKIKRNPVSHVPMEPLLIVGCPLDYVMCLKLSRCAC